jgi:riboflavin biosynthesis pyrimidine reductase
MDAHPGPTSKSPVLFERLLPAGDPAGAAEIVAGLGISEARAPARGRPRVMLNMISTVDGRASLDGRSRALSDPADRALFHALRSAVDAVLVGAGTARAEHYGRIVPDAARRAERQRRGLSKEPLACIVSERLELAEQEVPLLGEPAAHVVILTPSQESLPASAAHIDYIRAARDGHLDLPGALSELGARFDVGSVLCEGGPHLAWELVCGGLLDEMFLSLSPKLAGGEATDSEGLRILAGAELEPPAELELLGALRSGSHLFLRYGVAARERVSRETIESSSLAS